MGLALRSQLLPGSVEPHVNSLTQGLEGEACVENFVFSVTVNFNHYTKTLVNKDGCTRYIPKLSMDKIKCIVACELLQ